MLTKETGKITVLLVSTSLDVGGAQRFTSNLLRHLDRDRFRPVLCLLRREVGFPLPDDVPVHHFAYRRFWHIPATVGRLRRLIEDLRPDVLLSNITATNLVSGMALRGCRHRPRWVARIGTNPGLHDRPARHFLARRTYPRVDRFIVNARGLEQSLAKAFPFARGRIDALPNPTDFELIDELAGEKPERLHRDSEPLLIAVGRLFKEKRYDVMIDAVSKVRQEHPASLWICGDGPCKAAMQGQIKRLHLLDSVALLGFCRNPFSLMKQASIFLLSSDHEGLPNALIEAQGLGLPAVSTRCPHGPEEIIEEGDTGFLTPVGDPEAMAAAILNLLRDPAASKQMSEAARSSARRRFDARALSAEWAALIEREARRR